MELIPAIDLLDGRVVRLVRGDFEDATVYSDDPVAVARRWVGEGATRLHLVDLDGARTGRTVEADTIGLIVAAVEVPCQVAGGIRDAEAAARWLAAGADRVVMGTALIRDPEVARTIVRAHGPERLVAAIDVRGDRAVGEGWAAGAADEPLLDTLRRLREAGVTWFAVTAIARDGVLEGPDLDLLEAARAAVPEARIIASAGVTSIDDVRELAKRRFAAAILGRALYEGRLELGPAIAAAHGAPAT